MEQIRIARRMRDWSQERLAEAIGVKRSVISKYESGSISPSIDTIQRIAAALDIDVSYLLSGDSSVSKTTLAGGVHIYKCDTPHKAIQEFFRDFSFDSCVIYYQNDYLVVGVENNSTVSDEELEKIVTIYAPYRERQDYVYGKGNRYRIEAALNQMNNEGKSKVADYAEDILPRYRAEPAPQSPPDPQEGTDTTQGSEGSEEAKGPSGE